MKFSEKLKELRSEKGISQAKLAADIHISRSAVAKWENGLGLPNDESLKLLAEYFDSQNPRHSQNYYGLPKFPDPLARGEDILR